MKPIFKSNPGRKKQRSTEDKYITTVERLIYILSILDRNKHRTYSTTELAVKLNVTQRTIQRDIQILQKAEYPVIEMQRGQYAFPSDFSLRKAPLSKEQESLLSFMFEIATSLGGKFQSAFRELFKRLLAEDLYTPFFAKVLTGHIVGLPDSTVVRDLESAINEYSRIKIHYEKTKEEVKEYILEPVKIAFYDGFWYLITQKDGDVIKFRMERIKNVMILDEIFVISSEIDKMLSESVNIWFGNKRGEKVLIEVSSRVAQFFKERMYFPLQKIVKEKKDGTIVIETFPSNIEEIIHTIMHWIPNLIVLEPASLRIQVRKMAADYLKVLPKN